MQHRSLALIGAGDIALATARLLRYENYDTVYVMSRGQSSSGKSAAQQLNDQGYTVRTLTCDVTNWQSLEDAAAQIDHPLDSIIYSPAGQRVFKELDELTQHDWNQSLDIFVGGLVGSVKALSRHLNLGTTIVAMSGTSARTVVSLRHLAMGSAKAALEHAISYLSSALASRGVRVNGVACGPVETASNKDILSSTELEALRAWQSSVTLPGRLAQPEDIGRIVAALCGPAFEWMTGEVILADGGALKRTTEGASDANPLETLLEPNDSSS